MIPSYKPPYLGLELEPIASHHQSQTDEPSLKRILVVEDDIRVGSFITQGLRDEGYEVTWMTTGAEALRQLHEAPFSLILLDYMLPDRSGLEVARTIRSEGYQSPIVMVTARDAPEERQAAFTAGANEFLGKPFRFDDLLARINSLLGA